MLEVPLRIVYEEHCLWSTTQPEEPYIGHLRFKLASKLQNGCNIHLHSLGPTIAQFQNVGLRMQNICPCLLTTSSIPPGAEPRLNSLVIRLFLPTFNETTFNTGYEMEEMTTQPCQPT